MEIMVATSIFSGTLLMILVLFNLTLRINRKVEALRQVSQATRNFTEFVVREIRNGTIDYTGTIDPANCPANTPVYSQAGSKFLALVNHNGDRECFFLPADGSPNLKVTRLTVTGQVVAEQVNPANITIDPAKFKFYVRPTGSPHIAGGGGYPGVQPFVTLVMNVAVQITPLEPVFNLPYQTTVSTDDYTVPHK